MSIGRGQSNFDTSPFHIGEQALQQAAGVRAKMETIGQSFIRDHMPEQHSQFYQQLLYLFVGCLDSNNRPWAHILFGDSGFISAPNNKQLSVKLNQQSFAILKSQSAGSAVGLLGIELDTRRRNRASTQLVSINESTMELAVKQTFGNCPKYIHPRQLVKNKRQVQPLAKQTQLNRLDALAIELIEQADTFFVASFYPGNKAETGQGMDISHRGGATGFVRVISNNQLIIPDYAGNNFFNTLGNIAQTGKAGLLFIDFERGHLLSLSGQAHILQTHTLPDQQLYPNALRLWQFELETGYWHFNALPFSFELNNE